MLGNVGPGRLLDSRKYFVILVDPLGNGISSSPSNSRLQPGRKFPRITIADMARSEHWLLTRVLHLWHVHAVMGVSMGGMQSFQWAVQYPRFMDKVIPIVGSPRPTVYAWREPQRGYATRPASAQLSAGAPTPHAESAFRSPAAGKEQAGLGPRRFTFRGRAALRGSAALHA